MALENSNTVCSYSQRQWSHSSFQNYAHLARLSECSRASLHAQEGDILVWYQVSHECASSFETTFGKQGSMYDGIFHGIFGVTRSQESSSYTWSLVSALVAISQWLPLVSALTCLHGLFKGSGHHYWLRWSLFGYSALLVGCWLAFQWAIYTEVA